MEKPPLLTEIKALIDKYNKIIKETGESFNIFSILNIESNELCHSSFIAELLNPKGNHSFGDTFLKLFIIEVEKNANIKIHLNTKDSVAISEKYLGNISINGEEGGRIDIVVEDIQGNAFVIENKIYAYEQHNQLIRYRNGYINSPILYLTLFGDDATSVGNLKLNEHYYLISYKDQITNWLKSCIEKIKGKQPQELLIGQYLSLVKKLTSNSSLDHLKNEIVNLMSKNVKETFTIYNNLKEESISNEYKLFNQSYIYHLKDKLFNEFMYKIEKECDKKGFEFCKNWEYDRNADYGFYITTNNNKSIRFLFEYGDFEGFYYGVETDQTNSISGSFVIFQNLLWRYWDDNPKKFGNNQEDWVDISLKENGKIFKKVFDVVDELRAL